MSNTPVFHLRAGVPTTNLSLYHRIRFAVGDPAAIIDVTNNGLHESHLIIRDIEAGRARQHARATHVTSPADHTPADGLSGDREIATAQATAERLRTLDASRVIADRSLPLVFAHEIKQAGIDLVCDPDMGVAERRAKDEQEIVWLREAQSVTEQAVRMACELIASAKANASGVLQHDGATLTSERVRSIIDIWLLERGYSNPDSIVAGGTDGGDCHEHGSGELRTGELIIIDIFPRNKKTLYNGDCTRTVVHGDIPDDARAMHATVVEAKHAAISATRAGVTGEDVHNATCSVITAHGYEMGLPKSDAPPTRIAMTHGTGHGVGLEVHEPPLLDFKGPALITGDCLTIEPGLYCETLGGVRVEDMVIVRDDGVTNLNTIPEELSWA